MKKHIAYQENGWLWEPNEYGYPGVRLCNKLTGQRGKPVCDAIAVWRVTRKGSGYVSTAYFCDEHLAPDLRPESTQNSLF